MEDSPAGVAHDDHATTAHSQPQDDEIEVTFEHPVSTVARRVYWVTVPRVLHPPRPNKHVGKARFTCLPAGPVKTTICYIEGRGHCCSVRGIGLAVRLVAATVENTRHEQMLANGARCAYNAGQEAVPDLWSDVVLHLAVIGRKE